MNPADPEALDSLTPRLTDDEIAIYGWFAVGGRDDAAKITTELKISAERLQAAIASLNQRGLVHRAEDDGGHVRVIDPDLVANVASRPLVETIRRHQLQLEIVREQFSDLRQHYRDNMHRHSHQVEVIPRLEEVRAALAAASANCSREILSSQPGGNRDPEAMAEAISRDKETLARGVRIRTLYHHTARFNGPSQSYVAAASALGAEYRTSHELFGRLIVFDRELAFIPDASDEWGAVLIREPSIVHYLCEIFEQTWCQAEPFSNAATDGLEAVSSDIDRTIVRLLAAGLKDETIGRRLGMSLRTTRRHIAGIMEQLEAESRFQAGYRMASRELQIGEPPG